ncbi:MAG: gamma-type small acid-soluble spore protein [Bacilli bacterium]
MAKNQKMKAQKANQAAQGAYGTEFSSENYVDDVKAANAKAEANKVSASGQFAKQQPTE